MGKVVAIVNQKGGVGKTTTTVNLAAAIGAEGFRVLVVDLDPQGNATTGLGYDNKRNGDSSSYRLITGEKRASEIAIETHSQLWLIPSNQAMAGAEPELVDVENREIKLKQALSLIRDDYDFIFMDCPPSLGLITLNALCACDTVLVPVQCEFYALEGISHLLDTVKKVKRLLNQHIDIEGVLLTMHDSRQKLTQMVVEEVKRCFKNKVYATVVPRNVRVSEAPSHGKTVMEFDKTSAGAKAYNELAREFLQNNRSIELAAHESSRRAHDHKA